MKSLVYKILGRSEYETALERGIYEGSAADLADGFIHFSTGAQAPETAARHFAGRDDLVLLTVDAGSLPRAQLKWEPSRGGALFPHLYGPLDMKAVSGENDLPLGPDGRHIFPAGISSL